MSKRQWELDEVATIIGANPKNLREYAISHPSLYNVERGRWIDEGGVYKLIAAASPYTFALDKVSAMDKWNAHLSIKPPPGVRSAVASPTPPVQGLNSDEVQSLREVVKGQTQTLLALQSTAQTLSARVDAQGKEVADLKAKMSATASRARELEERLAEVLNVVASAKTLGAVPTVPPGAGDDPLVAAWEAFDKDYSARIEALLGRVGDSPLRSKLLQLRSQVPSAGSPEDTVAALAELGAIQQALPPAAARFQPGGVRRRELTAPTVAPPRLGALMVVQGRRYLVVGPDVNVDAARAEAGLFGAEVAHRRAVSPNQGKAK
jgi:hypothetical protein